MTVLDGAGGAERSVGSEASSVAEILPFWSPRSAAVAGAESGGRSKPRSLDERLGPKSFTPIQFRVVTTAQRRSAPLLATISSGLRPVLPVQVHLKHCTIKLNFGAKSMVFWTKIVTVGDILGVAQ